LVLFGILPPLTWVIAVLIEIPIEGAIWFLSKTQARVSWLIAPAPEVQVTEGSGYYSFDSNALSSQHKNIA